MTILTFQSMILLSPGAPDTPAGGSSYKYQYKFMKYVVARCHTKLWSDKI